MIFGLYVQEFIDNDTRKTAGIRDKTDYDLALLVIIFRTNLHRRINSYRFLNNYYDNDDGLTRNG